MHQITTSFSRERSRLKTEAKNLANKVLDLQDELKEAQDDVVKVLSTQVQVLRFVETSLALLYEQLPDEIFERTSFLRRTLRTEVDRAVEMEEYALGYMKAYNESQD